MYEDTGLFIMQIALFIYFNIAYIIGLLILEILSSRSIYKTVTIYWLNGNVKL